MFGLGLDDSGDIEDYVLGGAIEDAVTSVIRSLYVSIVLLSYCKCCCQFLFLVVKSLTIRSDGRHY